MPSLIFKNAQWCQSGISWILQGQCLNILTRINKEKNFKIKFQVILFFCRTNMTRNSSDNLRSCEARASKPADTFSVVRMWQWVKAMVRRTWQTCLAKLLHLFNKRMSPHISTRECVMIATYLNSSVTSRVQYRDHVKLSPAQFKSFSCVDLRLHSAACCRSNIGSFTNLLEQFARCRRLSIRQA